MNVPQNNILKKQPIEKHLEKPLKKPAQSVKQNKIEFPPVNYPPVLTNRWGDTDMMVE
ncbi:hypothetical protein Ga0466249_001360 [Sporomusaceae bacterium BoRhaA]|uniref:hypothetical protein n=1 Tax=Pelorhabdus rhamnosifermentans TaxID=2772457 RepID=UPI001C062CC1|nr:hypothetical protein [Pelorhabdus rhamnosifermentans]MBU2700268.1 hypothetical protein [Pelorhabdus rhamnosifermentans]